MSEEVDIWMPTYYCEGCDTHCSEEEWGDNDVLCNHCNTVADEQVDYRAWVEAGG